MAAVVQSRAVPRYPTLFGRRLKFQWPSPAYWVLIPLAIFAVLPIIYVVSTAFKPLE